jgi:hypothetical protein
MHGALSLTLLHAFVEAYIQPPRGEKKAELSYKMLMRAPAVGKLVITRFLARNM